MTPAPIIGTFDWISCSIPSIKGDEAFRTGGASSVAGIFIESYNIKRS